MRWLNLRLCLLSHALHFGADSLYILGENSYFSHTLKIGGESAIGVFQFDKDDRRPSGPSIGGEK